MRTALITIFASLLLASCTVKQGGDVPATNLAGTIIHESEAYLPGKIALTHGDTILEVSSHTDSMLNIVGFVGDTLTVIDSFGSYGSGPDEFIDAKAAMTPSGDYVILDVPSGTRIYTIPRGSEHSRSQWSHVSMDTLQMMGSEFVAINDSCMLIASAPFDCSNSIFSIIDFKNGKYSPTDFWPDDGYSGPPLPKSYLYNSNATLRTNGNGRYFYSALYRKYAVIFSLDSTHIDIISTLIDEPATYSSRNDGLMPTLHHLDGHIIRPTSNESHIYLLHCRKTADGSIAKSMFENRGGDEIDVYDWNGNLIKHYILDRLGFYIVTNRSGDSLYLLSENPDSGANEWVRYEIE